jgi:Right handed beta helix region
MSYTLRGRLETRLAPGLIGLVVAAVVAGALEAWWPLELATLMLAVGLAADVMLYDRVLDYQPGWLALPLGLAELGAVMALAVWLGIGAPLRPALAFFAAVWLVGQLLVHAGFPLWRLSYGDDGGELGRTGPVTAAAAVTLLAFSAGLAYGLRPPTVRLGAGVHQGPLLIDTSQRLVGEPGAVVRGGIRVTADDVVVKGIHVEGGRNGIEVDGARNVVIEDVLVTGSKMDGINVRHSSVLIRDCRVAFLAGEYTQGIDISFTADLGENRVERCEVLGAREGIVSDSALIRLKDNRVRGSTLRGISVIEMSMGSVEGNVVSDSVGVGIFCGDYSHCEVRRNTVLNTAPDRASDDGTRAGFAIQSHFGAIATLDDNRLAGNARDLGAFADGKLERN